jgi:5'-nucleotidase
MKILITNDDGVYSPGIAALAQVAARFGEVRIYAPDVEMSSASHAITASRPVTCKRTPLAGIEAYRVNGTPGDCVMLGSSLWEKVDLVLSSTSAPTWATLCGTREPSPARSKPRSSGCAASR